jgi:AraC-like DNA-binding protein
MTAIWGGLRIDVPMILRDHNVRVSAFHRIEGTSYARTEPAQNRAVMIFGRNGLWRTSSDDDIERVSAAFICGATARPICVAGDSVDGCIEVSMPPWVALQLMPELSTAHRVPVDAVQILGDADECADIICGANDLSIAGGVISNWLARKLVQQEQRQCRPEIVWAWRRIAQHGHATSVRLLANEIQWSERHFTNQFRAATGLKPKMAMRLSRFQSAHSQVTASEKRLGEIAYDCGYADQSHMNREFLEFAGISPGGARQGADVGVRVQPDVS